MMALDDMVKEMRNRKCPICGEYVDKDDMIFIMGERICISCANKKEED